MNWSEYWYMFSMIDKSLMTKNKIDPLVATGMYCYRIAVMFFSSFLLSYILTLMFLDAYWEFFRVYINSMSSRIVSAFAFFSNLKMLSYDSFSFLLHSPINTIFSSLCFYTYYLSCFTTIAKSCYSNPLKVTVKLMIFVLIKISGKKLGFINFVKM